MPRRALADNRIAATRHRLHSDNFGDAIRPLLYRHPDHNLGHSHDVGEEITLALPKLWAHISSMTTMAFQKASYHRKLQWRNALRNLEANEAITTSASMTDYDRNI